MIFDDKIDRPIPMRDVGIAPAPDLPRRFYAEAAAVEDADGRFAIRLDGKLAKTPGKAPLIVPSSALAAALASEWAAQGQRIDPRSMPLTRLVNSGIDGVSGREAAVAADMLRYAATDLLCYRVAYPPGLIALQQRHWDPVLDWARQKHGLRFVLGEGVMHVTQPEPTLARLPALIEDAGALELAALHSITTLTGSAILMLALRQRALDADQAWTAALVDEDWQISQWGEVEEIAARRQERERDFRAAVGLLAALR